MSNQNNQNGGNGAPNTATNYHGLGDIIKLLQGGINAQQYGRMDAGYTGMNGGIGGMHGAFGGLSPYAMHFLATSGLLQKQAAQQVATTNADGTPLTGSALMMAQLMNQLYSQQSPTYKMSGDVTTDQLATLFGLNPGGHSAYANGYDATGYVGGQGGGGFVPPHTPGGGNRHPRKHGR